VSEIRRVVILLAAGSGERLGAGEPKAFVPLGDRSLVAVAAAAVDAADVVDAVVLVVPAGSEARAAESLAGLSKPLSIVAGGPSRQASVRAAIPRLADHPRTESVACHDAARPFASPQLFATVFAALDGTGTGTGTGDVDGAIPTVAVADTVKRVRDGEVVATEPREELGLAQTPQAFRIGPFLEAHERAAAAGLDLSDDAAVLEWAGYRVVTVAGEPGNLKITTAGDLDAALERRGTPR
jgi:2-C-methyl-D-erythritol 4-phosphate cytidylyltransferase/2-C-methyl-D-erythritol 2,4-cyclodiphosphate synthase